MDVKLHKVVDLKKKVEVGKVFQILQKNQITVFFLSFALILGFFYIRSANFENSLKVNYLIILPDFDQISMMYWKKITGIHPQCKFTSSRHKDCDSSNTKLLQTLRSRITQLSLDFNTNAVTVRQKAQFQLSHFFRDKNKPVIWHDVVNNSLSPHRSKSNKPLILPQLFAMLKKYQERIEAIMYCPIERTPDIYDQLKRSILGTPPHGERHCV